MKILNLATLFVTVFFSTSLAVAESPAGIRGEVTVVNEDSDPVPVVVQNNGQGEPVEVFSALPEYYQVKRTVFGNNSPDEKKTVNITERIIVYEVMAQTSTIHQVAGCLGSVYREIGGSGGTFSLLFETFHFEKDIAVYRDGQTTQQRLGAGVVIEPGDNVVFIGGTLTNTDIPTAGPDAFCSTTVQLFGEVVPD